MPMKYLLGTDCTEIVQVNQTWFDLQGATADLTEGNKVTKTFQYDRYYDGNSK